MTYIYFGSSNFSCRFLEGLVFIESAPELIVSQPDKPKGRGLRLAPTEVSMFGRARDIPVLKPISLNRTDTLEELSSFDVDFLIVADYGGILPPSLLKTVKPMPLCVHPSLLPKYRGPAPIERSLINGEAKTGITIFRMNESIDAGDILAQESIDIEMDDNRFSLIDKLSNLGVSLFCKSIKDIESGNYEFIPQDDSKATFAPKFTKQDGKIDWNKSAREIRNLIRGTLGRPSAYAYFNGSLIKVTLATIIEEYIAGLPSVVVRIDKKGIYVATKEALIRLERLKPEGKTEMDSYSFVLGNNLKVGDKFE
ncbi:MAG: methionyl-tRNA formyltransferase [Candidatus Omnitrophota bacterium]